MAGCSSLATTLPVVTVQCPPLKDYAPATVQKSERELRAMIARDPDAATPGMIRDYSIMRRECRAIERR